jgi:glycosyltransferase involved in cell wall biosynthesis
LPTYREGFGLVLIEGLAYGMPLIITDQYATKEAVIEGKNGFFFPNHPLKDYDPETYRLLGKYYNPSDFYRDLFRFQQEGKLKPVEDFLVTSIEKFLQDPNLLEEFSRNSLKLYAEKFDADKISDQIESVFLEAVKK